MAEESGEMTQNQQKYTLWIAIFGLGWMMAVNFFLMLLIFGMLNTTRF